MQQEKDFWDDQAERIVSQLEQARCLVSGVDRDALLRVVADAGRHYSVLLSGNHTDTQAALTRHNVDTVLALEPFCKHGFQPEPWSGKLLELVRQVVGGRKDQAFPPVMVAMGKIIGGAVYEYKQKYGAEAVPFIPPLKNTLYGMTEDQMIGRLCSYAMAVAVGLDPNGNPDNPHGFQR